MSAKRLIPLLIIVILTLLAWIFEVTKYFSFQELKKHHFALTNYVQQHFVSASLIYMGTYSLVVALSIPVAVYMTLLGGYLFPQPYSTIMVVFSATLGACILFISAKTALQGFLKKKASPFLDKMRKGFRENEISYLLFLRFVPAVPFWLVNIAPAFFDVGLFAFFWTTAVGITPGAFAYAQIGNGLGSIFETEEEFSISSLLNNDIKVALAALGVIVLLPAVYRIWRKRYKYDR